MNLTDEDMKQIVSEATTNLKLQLTANLTDKLHHEVTYTASKAIRDHVEEWVKQNVLPEVTVMLMTGKNSLVNTAAIVAESMCEELSKAMTESLKEKLAKSWDRKKIFESMFVS